MPLPADIYAESGCRLPPVRREALDDEAKKQYDSLVSRTGTRSLAGLRGPGGLNVRSPAGKHLSALSQYLRYESGMSGRVREIAILTVAREIDHQFEWTAHEPAALKEGVPQDVIDVIKHRRACAHLSETDSTVIELGRQLFGRRRVESGLFARALGIFGERQLVELVMLMGNYSAVGALLTAFDVQLPAGVEPPLPPRPDEPPASV